MMSYNHGPSWDEYFRLIAKVVGTRFTCNSRPTGAVLVQESMIPGASPQGRSSGMFLCLKG
jgi:dCMP deaminase